MLRTYEASRLVRQVARCHGLRRLIRTDGLTRRTGAKVIQDELTPWFQPTYGYGANKKATLHQCRLSRLGLDLCQLVPAVLLQTPQDRLRLLSEAWRLAWHQGTRTNVSRGSPNARPARPTVVILVTTPYIHCLATFYFGEKVE